MAKKLPEGAYARRRLWNPAVQDMSGLKVAWVDGGPKHSFEWIAAVYGIKLVERLLEVAPVALGHLTPASAGQAFLSLKWFLVYLAKMVDLDKQTPQFGRVYGHIASYQGVLANKDDWHYVLLKFDEELIHNSYLTFSKDASNGTVRGRVANFSCVRRYLFLELGWPNAAPILGVGKVVTDPGQRRSHHKSLGDLVPGNKKRAKGLISELNVTRIAGLRRACEDILLSEERKFDDRSSIISSLDEVTYRAYEEVLDKRLQWREFKKQGLKVGDHDERLAIALRYISEKYPGDHASVYGDTSLKKVSPVSTIELLTHFEGREKALFAAMTIVLIDTGLNADVCLSFSSEPLVGSVKAGKAELHTVIGIKGRADFYEITGELLHPQPAPTISGAKGYTRLSGVDAIRIWSKLSAPVRARAVRKGNPAAGLFWITQGVSNNAIRLTDGYCYWEDFVLDVWMREESLRGIRFARKNIRPTLTQIRFYQSDGDAVSVAAFAKHKSPEVTLSSYLDHPHIAEYLDRKIISFQRQFESIFGHAQERAKKLFLSAKEFLLLREDAIENGLGFYCSAPRAGYQPGTAGKVCWKIDACSECPLLRFHANKSSVEKLLWFHRSLEVARVQFELVNPDRWIKVWLPALALCEAILDKIQRSRHRALLDQAEAKFALELERGVMSYFAPW